MSIIFIGFDDPCLFRKPGLLHEVKFLRNQFDANSKGNNYNIHILVNNNSHTN